MEVIEMDNGRRAEMHAYMRFRWTGLVSALAFVATLCVQGCSSPQMTPLMEYAGVKEMTTTELRIRMHEFAVRYPVIIEEAAYRIESKTEDPEMLKRALLWKIYVIPAYHRAMFRVDPYAALVDTWVLTVQMKNYFDSGPGAVTFGDLQGIVLETTDGMEAELIAIARMALGDDGLPGARREIYQWGGEHPIESHFFLRDSVIPLVADVMAGSSKGWAQGFESLEESLQELRMRITIYTDIIPKQIQWQLELTSLGLMEDADIQTALSDISELNGGLSRMETSLAGGFDRTAASIDDVSCSISGGFGQLGGTLLSGIRSERLETLAGLSSDMEPVLAELKKILDEGALTYETRSKAVADHIFWRGLILIGVFFAGLTIYRLATRGVSTRGVRSPNAQS